jgi:hypothetical protein
MPTYSRDEVRPVSCNSCQRAPGRSAERLACLQFKMFEHGVSAVRWRAAPRQPDGGPLEVWGKPVEQRCVHMPSRLDAFAVRDVGSNSGEDFSAAIGLLDIVPRELPGLIFEDLRPTPLNTSGNGEVFASHLRAKDMQPDLSYNLVEIPAAVFSMHVNAKCACIG